MLGSGGVRVQERHILVLVAVARCGPGYFHDLLTGDGGFSAAGMLIIILF